MHYQIADILIDIVQNSVEANSSLIIVDFIVNENKLTIFISDNGKGMDKETLQKAIDPFYTDGTKHKARKVGLGLPFLKQTCELAGGSFEIDSIKGEGTSLKMEFDLSNIDCPPIGDLSQAFLQTMLFEGDYELVINRTLNNKKYTVIRSELKDAIGDLIYADSLKLAKDYIAGLEEDILN